MSQTFGHVDRWVCDLDEFVSASLPSNDSQVSPGDLKSGGESPQDGLVGLPVNGWGLYGCKQHAIWSPGAAHMLTSGPWPDTHREAKRLWWRHLTAAGVRK